MAYDVYLGTVLLPVTPSKIKTTINNQNKTISLINEGEVNILKDAGLTEISLDIVFPNIPYSYAKYSNGFQTASYFLGILEELKTDKKPFQFIVSRTLPSGKLLFYTNIKVGIESYEIDDDASEGFDTVVSLKLKQYKAYGTKIIELGAQTGTVQTASREQGPKANTGGTKYIIQSGDTLWNIAKLKLGDGSKWPAIYEANKSVIEAAAKAHGKASSNNGNLIWAGTEIIIPNASEISLLSASGQKKTVGTYKGSGGSKTNPPYAILNSSYSAIKVNIKSWNEAYGYYNANNGNSKGWKIADANNRLVSL